MKIMTAKYKGKCYACDVKIKVGDTIWWTDITGSKHADCPAAVEAQTEADKREASHATDAVSEARSITQLGDFSDVYTLFEIAAKGGKWPRITINADGYEFYIYMSGQQAMIPNVLNVKDAGYGPGQGNWYGRITKEGAWDQRHKEVDERMADALSRLAMDPVGTVAMYGRTSGKCCFCKKQLTDDPSVEAGYGPVCAKRWGLAWGTKAATLCADAKVWGMTADGKYGPVTEKQYGTPFTETVTGQPAVINSYLQAANSAAVMGTSPEMKAIQHGVEHEGLSQEPVFDAETKCSYCGDTGKVANTEPGADDVVCMGCVIPSWNPDAAPVNFGELAALITQDAGTPPKETVTLKTKMITAKVNLPDDYSS